MRHVAVVDYGVCNVDSVVRALEECGGKPFVTTDGEGLNTADSIVLPGVGAFAEAMSRLRSRGLDEALAGEVADGVPILGICLGMQLLATHGTEGGPTTGLRFIDAEVTRLASASGERIPHVGWNEVWPEGGSRLLAGIESGSDFYFVHSYHVVCGGDVVAATTPYCGSFVSAVEAGHVFGVQFHPEKSQVHGFELLKNFLTV